MKRFLEEQKEKYSVAHRLKYPQYSNISERTEYLVSLARYQTARDILQEFECGESEIRTHEPFKTASLAKKMG